jgi:hypothetical protein
VREGRTSFSEEKEAKDFYYAGPEVFERPSHVLK